MPLDWHGLARRRPDLSPQIGNRAFRDATPQAMFGQIRTRYEASHAVTEIARTRDPGPRRVYRSVRRTGLPELSARRRKLAPRLTSVRSRHVVQGCQRRPNQNPLARRHRHVALCQTTGESPLFVVVSGRRRGWHIGVVAGLYARRNRLGGTRAIPGVQRAPDKGISRAGFMIHFWSWTPILQPYRTTSTR